LLALLNGTQVYERLTQLFRQADDRYNSGLFHFKPEKNRPPDSLDTLTLSLSIDDQILKDILQNLYYPDSPYEFSVLSADILGQVYEQFLGKVIRLTEGHHAKVEEKPEVKKAGGVYYTPTYIVSYIVQQTLSKINAHEKLRIIDPACGSGSFLLGAYQYLLDKHYQQYLKDNPLKWTKGRVPRLYQTEWGEWRLTVEERKRILLDSIYGVDIDPQAVEVTKLSLLLKVLEGETEQSLGRQLALFQARVLPDLAHNLKCGNSLIAPDFYDGQMALFNEEERYRINVFDWTAEFPKIMAQGGFDVVIGNPPYVRQESIQESKGYFERHYQVYQGTADLYAYFIEKGMSLLKKGGLFGFIVANKWLRANYGKSLRQWLKQYRILKVIDFGDLPVFRGATTYPCILTVAYEPPADSFLTTKVETLDFKDLESYALEHQYAVSQASLTNGWSLADESTQNLLDKIKQAGIPLGEYVKGKILSGVKTGLDSATRENLVTQDQNSPVEDTDKKIYRGVLTGLDKAFVIDAATRENLIAQDPKSEEIIKPFLLGREVKRYHPLQPDNYLIFMPKGWTRDKAQKSAGWNWLKKNYPAIAQHLTPFAKKGRQRCDQGEYWWELRACDYYAEFAKPKIIYPNICQKPQFTFDEQGLYANPKCFIISLEDKYLLGVLNSPVTKFLFEMILPKLRGDFYEPRYVHFKSFSIRPINFDDPSDKAKHERMVGLVSEMLDLHRKLAAAQVPQEKTMLKRHIEATDKEIDKVVYALYNLTEAEIKIVEGNDE